MPTWTTAPTFSAGAVLTAAQQNILSGNLNIIGDAMPAVTPTYTNFTLGNGTVTAEAAIAGKWVRYSGKITFGSTTAVTGTIRISLPATAASSTFGDPLVGMATLFDTSAPARRYRICALQSGTEFYMADLSDTRVDNTAPWTWGTGDTLAWTLMYEAA